jgi:tRNA threonylcarbamoyl adenosine modification protein (Sua5/YciO/YrdC/YwlC family)
MSQYFEVHPDNPQGRLLKQAAQILHGGGVAAIPTDSSYALVCHLDDKAAAENLRRIRGFNDKDGDKHHLTLLCRDLSELASYARVDNRQYRLLKAGTPGPYTFILEATKEVPRRVSHPSRRTIGLRVPDHRVTQALLAELGQPLLATTLIAPGETEPMNDPHEIRERFQKLIDAVVDAGACAMQPTTVVDLTGPVPTLIRRGRGDPGLLGLDAGADAGVG